MIIVGLNRRSTICAHFPSGMFPDFDSFMTFEARDLLWLLLPLAAASGWYAAYRDQRRKKSLFSDSNLSRNYFRGINHLLNEQPDKAIEVFTQMLEVNSETVETHLALGSLFRRRGEVERAIRIHQNLIARPTLDKAQRSQALCELAQDYHKAGLLDRAENLFLELTEIPAHMEQALRSLMYIYEQEKDWDKAIAVGNRLAKTEARDIEPVLAQYHCELGEHELHAGNAARARSCAKDALSIDQGCVRASILAGHAAVMQGNYREALRAWQKIEQQDARYLDEVIDEIALAFLKLKRGATAPSVSVRCGASKSRITHANEIDGIDPCARWRACSADICSREAASIPIHPGPKKDSRSTDSATCTCNR